MNGIKVPNNTGFKMSVQIITYLPYVPYFEKEKQANNLAVCVPERVSLILLECPNISSRNLADVSYYQGQVDSALHIPLLSVVPTLQRLKFFRQNLNIAGTPVQISMELGVYMYAKPPKLLTTTYL
jgi:hypothetical protein